MPAKNTACPINNDNLEKIADNLASLYEVMAKMQSDLGHMANNFSNLTH